MNQENIPPPEILASRIGWRFKIKQYKPWQLNDPQYIQQRDGLWVCGYLLGYPAILATDRNCDAHIRSYAKEYIQWIKANYTNLNYDTLISAIAHGDPSRHVISLCNTIHNISSTSDFSMWTHAFGTDPLSSYIDVENLPYLQGLNYLGAIKSLLKIRYSLPSNAIYFSRVRSDILWENKDLCYLDIEYLEGPINMPLAELIPVLIADFSIDTRQYNPSLVTHLIKTIPVIFHNCYTPWNSENN
ncbi:MAG: hypothetical protein KatS3mg054_0008 [Chloroflexus sp.]|nr:MAG: hypothetical protein KatS3mg054_0008 [Chloroflexus sp.]